MDRVDVTLEPVRAFLLQIGAFLPRLGLALVILIAGFLIARASRFAIEKPARDQLPHRHTARHDGFLKRGGAGFDTTRLFGVLCTGWSSWRP
jgi:hypothetical protein